MKDRIVTLTTNFRMRRIRYVTLSPLLMLVRQRYVTWHDVNLMWAWHIFLIRKFVKAKWYIFVSNLAMTITYSSNTKTYHSKKNSDIFTIAKWKRYIILSIIKKFAEFSYENNIWQYITLSLLIKLVNDIYILLNVTVRIMWCYLFSTITYCLSDNSVKMDSRNQCSEDKTISIYPYYLYLTWTWIVHNLINNSQSIFLQFLCLFLFYL